MQPNIHRGGSLRAVRPCNQAPFRKFLGADSLESYQIPFISRQLTSSNDPALFALADRYGPVSEYNTSHINRWRAWRGQPTDRWWPPGTWRCLLQGVYRERQEPVVASDQC